VIRRVTVPPQAWEVIDAIIDPSLQSYQKPPSKLHAGSRPERSYDLCPRKHDSQSPLSQQCPPAFLSLSRLGLGTSEIFTHVYYDNTCLIKHTPIAATFASYYQNELSIRWRSHVRRQLRDMDIRSSSTAIDTSGTLFVFYSLGRRQFVIRSKCFSLMSFSGCSHDSHGLERHVHNGQNLNANIS
jgi:hypothetical protein